MPPSASPASLPKGPRCSGFSRGPSSVSGTRWSPRGAGTSTASSNVSLPIATWGLSSPRTTSSSGSRISSRNLTRNIGCSSLVTAVCADKVRTGAILRRHGIPVPETVDSGPRVVKPIRGCGSTGVRITEDAPGEDEFAQRYIEGEHLSASLVGSMNVGEACLYFSGKPPLALAINRQEIEVKDGAFHYLGGETPVDHPRSDEIFAVARKAVTVLGCQGYAGVDMVVGDQVYVVDVNPRITTSIIGIAAVMEEEIAGILVEASQGKGPDAVHLNGRVRFTKDGRVTRL